MNTPYFESKTARGKVTTTVVGANVVIKSTYSSETIKIPTVCMFDLLKERMSTRSIDAGTRRRALQLNGYSINDALNKCLYFANEHYRPTAS
jgi:hypothetical protein